MILANKVFRKILQLTFGFDKWHVSPLAERPYAIDIIRYCNKRSSRSGFIEIGCGLGDIIRNVDYEDKTGYDADASALKAARFLSSLNRSNVSYYTFRFPESNLTGKADVIILVNWIHLIEPEMLRKKIGQYFNENLKPGGAIIVDTVQDKQYKYNHQINHLTPPSVKRVEKIGSYAREREVWAIVKNNN